MDGRHHGACQGGVKLAPFPSGHHGPGGKAKGIKEHGEVHGIGGEHLAEEGHRGRLSTRAPRRSHGPLLRLGARVGQHGPGEHVLGFRVGRHTETRDIDANDADPVDGLRQ